MGAKTNELLGLISLTGRNSGTIFQNTTASVSSKGPMILLQATKDPPEKLRKYPRGGDLTSEPNYQSNQILPFYPLCSSQKKLTFL